MARKRKYKKRVKQKEKIDLKIIGTIVFSVVLAVLIYANSGVLGEKLNEILGGMIGILRYVLPIGTFGIAITMAANDKENEHLTHRLIQYTVLMIFIAIVLSVYQISQGTIEVGGDISQVIKKAYTLGGSNIGGGAIGTLAAVPLVKLLGNLGATVLSIGVSIILFAIVFGIDLSEIFKRRVDDALERYDEKKEEREIRREEREKEAQLKKAELKEKRKQLREQQMAEDIARQSAMKQSLANEQIEINLNGKPVSEANKEGKKHIGFLVKKGKAFEGAEKVDGTNTQDALFKQEEEQKEDKTKQVLQLEHTMVIEEEEDNYIFPSINLLSKATKKANKSSQKILQDTAAKLQRTLYSFGVKAKVENVSVGPAITRYELKPAEGERVGKIAKLSDDIALNLAAESIRIEAPIPGKQAVGIEIPNQEKEMVPLRDVIESPEFQNNKSKLSVALGKDVSGGIMIADIAKMPHVLIAGATGSGKSVCINTIITSIIYNAKPSEVKLVMVDPKVVELSIYNGIPHLLIPVVTDPKKAAGALAWAVQEMDDRYNKFAEKGVRDLKGYNHAIEEEGGFGKMPQIVVIIDELADLMMAASKEVEASICRLAQKARAAGMHLVIATQRPSVDVITGLIKANVPSRIAFAVASRTDSGTILDQIGAEKLLGKGDMLYFPVGSAKPSRVQGCFVSDEEVEKIVTFIKSNGTAKYNEDILETIENSGKTDQDKNKEDGQSGEDDVDPFLQDAIETVVETGQASTSFIQRRFKVGYARAGRIIDQLEERGVIGKYQGSKPREVLWTPEKLAEMKTLIGDSPS